MFNQTARFKSNVHLTTNLCERNISVRNILTSKTKTSGAGIFLAAFNISRNENVNSALSHSRNPFVTKALGLEIIRNGIGSFAS